MAIKTVKKKPAGKKAMTNAERQKRFRDNQRKDMDIDQEDRALKKLWLELRDILDTLPYAQLYAIAPILRYMKHSSKLLDEKNIETLIETMHGLDLSSFPGATFNRDDDKNAELEADEAEDD